MKSRSELSKGERKIVDDVREHGWHVVNVLPERGLPGWAYTIGLYQTYRQPEVILFGLRGETMHGLLNNVGEKVQAGHEYVDEETDEELLTGYLCSFRKVLPKWYEQTVGFGRGFYGGSRFPLLQLFWPDRAGKFPWEPKCDDAIRNLQPRLFESDVKLAGAGWFME